MKSITSKLERQELSGGLDVWTRELTIELYKSYEPARNSINVMKRFVHEEAKENNK